ncbi:hypothetical protein GCM10023322_05610 [Rugosimonospora acidiphila]|uniref:Uncharacterized protein n=1 Tax=Rugosimonospora acidiphila TaxID=556531 RepID=A0ABP9RIM2_9ACTN
MTNLRVYPVDHGANQPAPIEPTEPETRTFADIENGEPEGTLDEIALDAAIL